MIGTPPGGRPSACRNVSLPRTADRHRGPSRPERADVQRACVSDVRDRNFPAGSPVDRWIRREGARPMSTRRGRRWWFGAATAVSGSIVVLTALPGAAQQGSPAARRALAQGTRSAAATFDARAGVSARMQQAVRAARQLRQSPPALRRLDASLGVQGVVQFDPITGTPRIVAKLNGFLSGPHAGSPRTVAIDYLRAHEAAFGITDATLGTLSFARDYVSIDGTHHLAWTQQRAGIDVFGSGLRINVTKDGRVINVLGSPVGDLAGVSTAATVPASRAISTAMANAELTDVTGLPAVTSS